MLAALAVCSAAFGPWGSAPRARAEARCAATMAAPLAELRTKEELRSGIAGFYDKSSGIWERVWGEHMHHGYYPGGAKKDHRQAQVDMIDEVLAWSGVADRARAQPASRPLRILDVGCGIGGSTRHIAREYGMVGEGITLSPVQAERANALTASQGLSDALVFSVADALQMPYADDSFDLVWSLESGEHMPDREKFVSELARVLKPGGDLVVVAWCHRDLRPDEDALQPRESRRVAPLAIRDAPASLRCRGRRRGLPRSPRPDCGHPARADCSGSSRARTSCPRGRPSPTTYASRKPRACATFARPIGPTTSRGSGQRSFRAPFARAICSASCARGSRRCVARSSCRS